VLALFLSGSWASCIICPVLGYAVAMAQIKIALVSPISVVCWVISTYCNHTLRHKQTENGKVNIIMSQDREWRRNPQQAWIGPVSVFMTTVCSSTTPVSSLLVGAVPTDSNHTRMHVVARCSLHMNVYEERTVIDSLLSAHVNLGLHSEVC